MKGASVMKRMTSILLSAVLCLGSIAFVGGCGKNQPPASSSVVILVSKEQMDVIRSLPRDLACFTPAKNPIKSMEGINDEEFASWVGADFPQRKLMAAFGRKDTVVGLRMMGTGGFSFDEDPKLRLFITLESFADDIIKGGGVRIVFKEK